jgi:YD repeat-containing protein
MTIEKKLKEKSKTKKKSTKALKRANAAVEKFMRKNAAAQLGFASNTVSGPASIEELARALRNDVDLIYQFVHDNIEFYPMYGVQKGALGTLIDGLGNPFDQSALMVALLREAGYTADFMFGQITLTPAELKNWLGTDDTDPAISSDLLDAVGIPYTVNMTGMTWDSTTLDHVWVKVDIGGTDYVFDPSYKTYVYEAGVNLSTAIGFNKSAFQANAQTGATITATSVLNINRNNIRNDLQSYSEDLLDYIQNNNPNASLDEIIGGRKIVPVSSTLRQTSLSYETGSPTLWSSIPNGYRTTVRLQFPKPTTPADITYYSDDIYHKRLAFGKTVSGYPELRLDGVPVVVGEWFGYGGDLTITITHSAIPGASEVATSRYLETGADNFTFGFAFGPCTKASADYHKLRQQENVRAAGASPNWASEPIHGESMLIHFFAHMAQLSMKSDIIGRMRKCMPIFMHHGGIIGYYNIHQALFMIMHMNKTLGFVDLDAGVSNAAACSDAYTVLVNGTEASATRQQLQSNTIGTNRAVEAATIQGVVIYDVDAASWSTISPNFYFWDSTYLTMLKTRWIDNGGRGIVCANGQMPIDGLLANGFYASLPSSNHYAAISFGWKGVQTTDPDDPEGGGHKEFEGGGDPNDSGLLAYLLSEEPIDLFSGQYIYDKTDMTVGSGNFPYSLPFSRHYRSMNWSTESSIGNGWQHNYDWTAGLASNVYLTLGDAPAVFAVAHITALYAITDILVDPASDALADIVTAALIERWQNDQWKNNTVIVSSGTSVDFLLKLVDGTYLPVDAQGSSVTFNGSNQCVYTSRHGDTLTFATNGTILTLEKANGPTVTFTHADGLLQSVENGMGRKLSFSYDSTGKLTEVFDNTGRDIGFRYDSAGDLLAVRDTKGRETTYEYDSRSKLEKIFLPENPTTALVTNAYDSFGRVLTQTDGESNQWEYFFAHSRSEEVDPLSNSKVDYFNSFGQPTRMFDQLGNETTREYDAFKRETKRTMPEGNSIEMEYDGASNMLTLTKVAKGGSGLSDIVNTFTYDTDWNKVETFEDGEGNITTYAYDSLTGDLLNIQRPMIGGQTPQISFTYNVRGQMVTVTRHLSLRAPRQISLRLNVSDLPL